MDDVAILGTGMAAYGAAQTLRGAGVAYRCYDRNAYPGGHTASFALDSGFTFDDGPHVSFTKDERIQELLARNVDGQYETVPAHVNNLWQGHWITHPAQLNLHGLPTDLVVRIMTDFIEVHASPEPPVANYAEWLVASYGRTFAETFPMQYGKKYHTTTAETMTTDWLGPRMYRPSLEEMLRGAVAPQTANVHYVTSFRYPTRGGFAAYLQPFFRDPALALRHDVSAIDPRERTITFANGTGTPYSEVISSIPLPDLVERIVGVPDDVSDAARKLAFTTAVMVNVGVARDDLSEAHISYFYDDEIVFPRATFPHMLSPNNVPAGAGSIQVELYFSDKYKPLDGPADAQIDGVLDGLRVAGILRADDTILCAEARTVRYANVIFDHDRASNLALVHGYLDDVGIAYCGRYGDWDHAWTDESFLSGERAAARVLQRA
jgi:protoporphyrinogen oxidase